MSTSMFCDISSFQGNIDFVVYRAWAVSFDGIARIAMKSSEGVGFTDPHFQANRAAALAAGIDCIYFYHFGRPDLGNSAISEANFMHSVVGNVRNSDLLVLDYEVASPMATAEWAYEWLVQQETNAGKVPAIYASTSYIQENLQLNALSRYKLWLANWQFTPDERPPVPAPWQAYEFVQYTDNATNIPGIPGNVDCNIYLGASIPPPQEDTVKTIDLTDPTVASHFTGGSDIWQCKDNGFIVGHGILGFYQKFGGEALCGLTYLGLPTSNETAVAGHPGVVYQRFERGVLAYDGGHTIDNPPGSADVYLMHIDSGLGQDPRITQLQSQITDLQVQVNQLKNLPIVTNLEQITTIGQRIRNDVDLVVKLATVN